MLVGRGRVRDLRHTGRKPECPVDGPGDLPDNKADDGKSSSDGDECFKADGLG